MLCVLRKGIIHYNSLKSFAVGSVLTEFTVHAVWPSLGPVYTVPQVRSIEKESLQSVQFADTESGIKPREV